MKTEINFRESEFSGEMETLRSKILTEVEKGAALYNSGQISLKDYRTAKEILMDKAKDARADILFRRKEAVAEASIKIDQLLSESGDVKEFRQTYESLMAKNKQELLDHYSTSLRLNDQTALRANALASADKGINETLTDYGKRDSVFVDLFKEREALKERYTNPEKRMADQLGTYRSVLPPDEKITHEPAGNFLDQEAGQWRSYFRPKVTVKK